MDYLLKNTIFPPKVVKKATPAKAAPDKNGTAAKKAESEDDDDDDSGKLLHLINVSSS